MKISIIGGGGVGSRLASWLAAEGHDVIVVDKDRKVLESISNAEDVMCLESTAVEYVVHMSPQADKVDILIACTNSDEVNMITCLIGRKNGAKYTIARVRKPEYANQIPYIKKDFGISLAINPELSAANTMSRVLLFPAADSVEIFTNTKAELIEFKIKENNPLIGKTLTDIGSEIKGTVLICAISRNDNVFIPTGSDKVELGDSIYVTAGHEEMESFFKKTDSFRSSVKSVIIIGGGQITYYLASRLLNHGIKVKIIEEDAEKCDFLAEELPDALIVNADGRSEEILGEEGIENVDALVATTGMDEVNSIISVYAKQKGVKKVITKINQKNLMMLFKHLGIESIVSPKEVTANRILQYVRGIMASAESNSIETLTKIVDGNIEALEFIIRENSSFVSKKIRDLKIKKDYLVACITRNGKIIIPSGDDSIEIGDSVIIITTTGNTKRIEDIFD